MDFLLFEDKGCLILNFCNTGRNKKLTFYIKTAFHIHILPQLIVLKMVNSSELSFHSMKEGKF